MHTKMIIASALLAATSSLACAGGEEDLPFDFSDEFYAQNGLDPAAVPGRPTGTGPNSVIDTRENGPDLNDVRVLQTATAYDHSGHPIFFYVTGIIFETSFLDNAAGAEAREIADFYKVYEFPRATNPLGAAFPKRQDFIADLRNGYFSNDPLGLWQVNLCKYTDAAFNTSAGQESLAELGDNNGLDLDGTPLIRTMNELEALIDDGFVEVYTPPADGSGGLRWFMCPVIEDPRNGAIAPDAHIAVTDGLAAADEFINAFHCLQTTGDWCDNACFGDWTGDGRTDVFDVFHYLDLYQQGLLTADVNRDGSLDIFDVFAYLAQYEAGC
ncbi:MAG: hypothetical protein KC996_07735 [Phycisphaerales bacterium]|nr:hypothetical protein [Phycisphaerales bacterium]